MGKLLRHRQTKGPVSARLSLNCRATPRLHLDIKLNEAGSGRGRARRSETAPKRKDPTSASIEGTTVLRSSDRHSSTTKALGVYRRRSYSVPQPTRLLCQSARCQPAPQQWLIPSFSKDKFYRPNRRCRNIPIKLVTERLQVLWPVLNSYRTPGS